MNAIKTMKLSGMLALVLSVAVGCASTPMQDSGTDQAIAQARSEVTSAQSSGYSVDKAAEYLTMAEEAAAAGDTAKAAEMATKAQQAVAAAKAIASAKGAVKMAQEAGNEWRDTGKMIKSAEEALAAGDTAKAIKLAKAAEEQANDAVEQRRRENARMGDSGMSGSRGVGMASDSYTVERGDSLWRISGKDSVYGNPYQWPLIYKANRDQIRDADLIFPGQNLSIERGMSAADIDAAVMHAKTRGAWSVGPVEASDRAYLAQ